MTTAATPRLFTGRHMLVIMVGFFATVFAANMTLVYFASHSWSGLVVANSYVASQEFNAITRKLETAAALDIHVDLSHAAGTLRLSLHSKAGTAVEVGNVTATLGRPSHEGEDHTVQLTAKGSGIYEVQDDLAAGQWTGTVAADVPGFGPWTRPIRLIVKP